MTSASETLVQEAREAFSERAWSTALGRFEAAAADGPLAAEDLERWGECLWWLGRLSEAIEVRQRAYKAFQEADDERGAARVALSLVADHNLGLESSLAAGWRGRAERLLADVPESVEHARLYHVQFSAALGTGDLDGALAVAAEMLELAKRLGDADVEALALHDRARVLIAMGSVDEGISMLDEAVVSALSGELSAHASAIVYCNATIACEDLTDYRRASQFAEAARRWCDSQEMTGFPGMCRVRRVEIIRLQGDWAAAEQEARKACQELEGFSVAFAAEGHYQLGEIHLRRGDLAEADAAFSKADAWGRDPMPGVAWLRLAQGDPAAAAALSGRALVDHEGDNLGRARLLPVEVASALELDDLERAERAAGEASLIASTFNTHLLRAEAAQARGSVALRRGDSEASIPPLREAIREWRATDAPWETARARMLLGEAYLVGGETAAAELELAAAGSTFSELGAKPDVERVQALRGGSAKPRTVAAVVKPAVRTFMFTDIVRSTSLLEAVGDEAWAKLLSWHDAAIRRVVSSHRGQEVDHAGDGFFIAFESADDAVACALAIRTTMAEHRDQAGFAPEVRIGLHSTAALRTAEGYAGSGVHIAARIGGLAGGSQVLVSRAVVEAASEAPPHDAWHAEKLKGIAEPVDVAALS